MVYFTLSDDTPERQQSLVDDCHRYLAKHPGVVHFSAGLRGAAFTRPVNDQTFHVALVVVFDSQQSHDDYQAHPQHVEFIERNKANWKQVRVFDAMV
jgi:heme-degrading monooxygenase HmoA